MPSPASRPVAVVLGLVPTVLGGVRALPGKAVQLPVYAVSHALTSIGAARQGYDDLAERGERLIAKLRGTSFDEVEDRVEDALRGTPLAGAYEKAEDALEDATEKVSSIAKAATGKAATGKAATGKAATGKAATGKAAKPTPTSAPKPAGTTPTTKTPGDATATPDPEAAAKAVAEAERAVAEAAERAERAAAEAAEKAVAAGLDPKQVERERKNPAQAAKGTSTPKAGKAKPAKQDVDTAATPAVVEAVEKVSAQVGGGVLEHDALPLPDYDHLTLGSLRGRMRSLDLPQLVQIRDYERAHADRLPIVTMLDNRIARLANDPTAPLSGSDPAATAPEKAASAPSTDKASPKTADAGANDPGVAFGGLGSSAPK